MAAPNIVNVTTITGKTNIQAVSTVATAIVTCPTNNVYKVNSLIIANIDGANTATITVELYNVSRSPASTYISFALNVPPKSSLTLITKDYGIYLEEGDAIRCTASANGDLHAVCSYEAITNV